MSDCSGGRLHHNVFVLQGYHALQAYRVAHKLWNEGRKLLALALQSRISEVVFAIIAFWFHFSQLNVWSMLWFDFSQVFGIDIHPGKSLSFLSLLEEHSQFLFSCTLVDQVYRWTEKCWLYILLCFSFCIAARIGEGILLDHGTGVVIGETAVIGNRVSILHVSKNLCLQTAAWKIWCRE